MDKKVLIQRLDRLVSILVRRSEDRCATCGKKLPWRYRQAGHFVPRVVHKTRWDLDNVHVQCAHCNVELGGNLAQYAIFLQSHYGDDVLNRLESIYGQYKRGELKELNQKQLQELYWRYYEEVQLKYPKDIPESWKNY